MGLLLVPLILAFGAFWLNSQEKQRELQVTEQRSQEAVLQAYLDEAWS
jgi:hypothetical protein